MKPSVRVRFAPSPTGALHIGGIRTALYNYLFAKQQNGQFLLRIEDTDQTRFVEGAEKYIIDSLTWLGLIPDEGQSFGGEFGPYRQSERTDIYKRYAEELVSKGYAYYAFDTSEALEQLRNKNSGPSNQTTKYDYSSRMSMQNSLTISAAETKKLIEDKHPYTIRIKVPESQEIKFNDTIRDEVRFRSEELDDKVLIKSDGLPTYHLANVIDDRLMKITHVIRGEEWLSSTAHHVLLYRFFGWEEEMPIFSHLPLILKPNGHGKLSKRDGAQFGFPVFPMEWLSEDGTAIAGFKEFGFLPNALLNFLALLGWHPETDQEILSLEEMVQQFSLNKIVKSGARFDYDKAKWFNQQYILQSSADEIKNEIEKEFYKHEINLEKVETEALYEMYKERVHLISDFYRMGKYLVMEIDFFDPDFPIKKWKKDWTSAYEKLKDQFENLSVFSKDELEQIIMEFMKLNQFKMGEVLPTLRYMISGMTTGPDIYKMLDSLGQDKVVQRIQNSLNSLRS
ncbi:MAG: glutamate--tRNA ligase [Bacteroidota bacterium]|nr:glutamate--tRNA ligase [Bacteroidota bacterium]